MGWLGEESGLPSLPLPRPPASSRLEHLISVLVLEGARLARSCDLPLGPHSSSRQSGAGLPQDAAVMPIKVEAAKNDQAARSMRGAQAQAGSEATGVFTLWRGARLGLPASPPGLMQSLQLAGSPGPGLDARTERQGLLRAPPAPAALGMTSLSGAGIAHRGMCAWVTPPFHPAGDDRGAVAGLRGERWGAEHVGHTLYTWPVCVLPPCPRICAGPHVGRRSPSAGQEGAEGDPRAHV